MMKWRATAQYEYLFMITLALLLILYTITHIRHFPYPASEQISSAINKILKEGQTFIESSTTT